MDLLRSCLIFPTLEGIHHFIWGPWMLALIMGVGLVIHTMMRFHLFTSLPFSFKLLIRSRSCHGKGQISPFRALMTTLSATVGTGSIAGVATAIATGGPGALFWMWVAGIVGMATKFAEAVLAVHFRTVSPFGEYLGGPMYYISRGLGPPFAPLAIFYACCTAITAFGLGNLVQANAVAEIMQSILGVPKLLTGALLAAIVGVVVLGGLGRVAQLAGKIVPLMAALYVGAGFVFLIVNFKHIPSTLSLIFESAFAPTPVIGGFAGSAVSNAMRMGISRGIFANEAGLGSGAISHAAAQTKSAVNQGFIAMWGTIIDTLIICNMSGLIILISGEWTTGQTGATLTSQAFCSLFPWGGYLIAISLLLFSFTTILGWGFYGERCFQYMVGEPGIPFYRMAWVLVLPLGSVFKLSTVWLGADIMNALMAFPNLLALALLSPLLVRICRGKA